MAGDLAFRVRTLPGVISTDDIIPGRYKHMFTEPERLAPHVFENLHPGFADTLRPHDALWADDTFGIGSSREQAVSALAAAGVGAVLAPRFGRIFFRNAWNLGLPAIELAPPRGLARLDDDRIRIDLARGVVEGIFGAISFAPPAARLLDMVDGGGLLAVVARGLANPAPSGPGRRRTDETGP